MKMSKQIRIVENENGNQDLFYKFDFSDCELLVGRIAKVNGKFATTVVYEDIEGNEVQDSKRTFKIHDNAVKYVLNESRKVDN